MIGAVVFALVSNSKKDKTIYKIGDQAPDFTLVQVNKNNELEEIKLSDYNELQELRNLDTITLNDDEYSIITDASGKAYINELDSTKEITMSNGVKLKQKEIL